MKPDVQHAVESSLGGDAKVTRFHTVSGGCINKAWQVYLQDDRQVFVKEPQGRVKPDHFQVEADGLIALKEPGCIRVPEVLGVTQTDSGIPLLILEYISSAAQPSDFQATLGRQLAQLHQATQQQQFGWRGDNLLGASIQSNVWADDWVGFVRRHRLGYQFDMARRNGHGDSGFTQKANQLLDQLDSILDCDEQACLLHGDLWGGNVMADQDGQPVIMDPAVYYGQREADLAMTHLFGGFTSDFYEAYNQTWPLPENTMRRQKVFILYHLLNHLNLFGRGYYGQCVSLMQELL